MKNVIYCLAAMMMLASGVLISIVSSKIREAEERENKISELELQIVIRNRYLAKQTQDFQSLQKRINEAAENVATLTQQATKYQKAAEIQITMQEALLKIYKDRIVTLEEEAAKTPSRSNSSSGIRVTSSSSDDWIYPAAHEAKAIATQEAKAKWGDDYQMVEYHIRQQVEAHEKLRDYAVRRTSDPTINRLLNAAALRWGNDYDMILHVVKGQAAAKARLEGR